jgi:AraC-like DNA-binding protein
VSSYLLKPIENDKLEDMLGAVHKRLEKRRTEAYDRRHLREVVDEYRLSLAGEYLEALNEESPTRRLALEPLVKQLDVLPFGGRQTVLAFALDSQSVLANSESVRDMESHEYLLYRALRERAAEWENGKAIHFGGTTHHILLNTEDEKAADAFYCAIASVLYKGAGLKPLCGIGGALQGEDGFRTGVRQADEALLRQTGGKQPALLSQAENDCREHRVVEQAQQFIQSRYNEPISLVDIAEHTGVSPNYLSGLFSRETGESYIKHLTRVRMEAAARLLSAEKDKNMTEVAAACGFCNVKHFFRVFRLSFGMCPGEYRSQEQK